MNPRKNGIPGSGSYDAIVIGAGHNGLTCATYLAKAGRRVLVLESADVIGGLAARQEFHPGFHVSVAHSVNHFSSRVARELDLHRYGFHASTTPLRITGLREDGQHLSSNGQSLDGISDADQAACHTYSRLLDRFARHLAPFWHKTIPRIGNSGIAGATTFAQLGLSLRRLGKRDMREFLRIFTLPTRDLMDEYFEEDLLKVILSWDGLVGSKLAPRSPNSSIATMLYRMAGESGATGVVDSLRSAAEAAGVEIRTGAPVRRIRVENDATGLTASGVELESGDAISAGNVVSSADPRRTFFELVGVEHLEIGFTHRIRRLRCDGQVAKLHLALSDLPRFSGLDHPDGRLILAPNLDAIEDAYDAAKYGSIPESPVMEIVLPTLQDPSLAPSGQHVLSAHVMYVPYRLRGGWDEATRKEITERTIATIERYAPGIRDLIIHDEFLTPEDLEQKYCVTGGHWHHVEFAVDQLLMMRPTYEAAQYRTPIPGLYLCGAGSHPGGDLTAIPGHNAAREILR